MSILVVTSLGDIVIDLHTDRCPLTTKNFLKLCKIKYYNGCLFHNVQKDFTAQTGDPTGKGTGGDSLYKFIYGDQARFFGDEIHPDLKHSKTGTVSMASAGESLNASQFYFTLRDDLDYLDGKHTVFGEVAEGLDTLMRINEAYVDDKGRPYKNIRIKHTYILDDPFDDPPQLAELVPDASPEGKPLDELEEVRLEDDWVPMDEQLGPAELEEALRKKEAHSSAVVLETIGDIPEAEIKPPENVLFVCKLNPVTQDDDLNTIFSRFGNVVSADIIRDFKTGDSLCYAFIEFEDVEACEQAYFKMDNALIDDRRIHVDFSQSVSKLWSQYRQKGNQAGKGRGCFKCGALDHIAKDCTDGSDAKQPPPKYILKDNTEHGGDDLKGYEMLFDEDATRRPDQERHRDHVTGEKNDKWKAGSRASRRSEDRLHRDRDQKDSTSDRYRHDRRSREHWEAEKNERDRGSKQSLGRRDYEHRGERSTSLERHGDGENGKRLHDSSRRERDEGEYRKRSKEGDREYNSDLENENRKRQHDSSRREREERVYGKRGREGDRSKYLDHDDKETGKRERHSSSRSGREKDERDYRKRSRESDRDTYSDHRYRDERRR